MKHRAVLDGVVIAESDDVVRLEGNVYFPAAAVKWERLRESDHSSVCPWKGTASYFDAEIDGRRHPNVGWTYRNPSSKAAAITDHVAFWGAVRVQSS